MIRTAKCVVPSPDPPRKKGPRQLPHEGEGRLPKWGSEGQQGPGRHGKPVTVLRSSSLKLQVKQIILMSGHSLFSGEKPGGPLIPKQLERCPNMTMNVGRGMCERTFFFPLWMNGHVSYLRKHIINDFFLDALNYSINEMLASRDSAMSSKIEKFNQRSS